MRQGIASLTIQRLRLATRAPFRRTGAAWFYGARDAKRTVWSPELGEKMCPYTSELVQARGRALESMVVGYCDKGVVDAEDRRRIDDSFLELVLPFSTDPTLRDSWLRSDGYSIRYGKLFELLDALAADVCYRHAGCQSYKTEKERYLVTASVDGVTASARIDPTQDLVLQAYLTYVGKSSMECTIDFISGGRQVRWGVETLRRLATTLSSRQPNPSSYSSWGRLATRSSSWLAGPRKAVLPKFTVWPFRRTTRYSCLDAPAACPPSGDVQARCPARSHWRDRPWAHI